MRRFTKLEYDDMIHTLEKAKRQLEPNTKACPICEARDHYAWKCHRNPLARLQAMDALAFQLDTLHRLILDRQQQKITDELLQRLESAIRPLLSITR